MGATEFSVISVLWSKSTPFHVSLVVVFFYVFMVLTFGHCLITAQRIQTDTIT